MKSKLIAENLEEHLNEDFDHRSLKMEWKKIQNMFSPEELKTAESWAGLNDFDIFVHARTEGWGVGKDATPLSFEDYVNDIKYHIEYDKVYDKAYQKYGDEQDPGFLDELDNVKKKFNKSIADRRLHLDREFVEGGELPEAPVHPEIFVKIGFDKKKVRNIEDIYIVSAETWVVAATLKDWKFWRKEYYKNDEDEVSGYGWEEVYNKELVAPAGSIFTLDEENDVYILDE